jgi:hypothetical protein
MSLTPQTLRCYLKAEIRQGADRVSAPTLPPTEASIFDDANYTIGTNV